MVLHIIERGLIHLFSAMGLLVGTFFALQTLHRRQWSKGWLPSNIGGRLVVACLLVFGVSTMREPWDVAHGQPVVKAATDFASWCIGLGLGAWGTYRLIWLNWER